MSTAVATCPVVQTADAYRAAFGALAGDKLLTDAARTASLLARAIASADNMDEFYAISRFNRRVGVGAHMAPLAGYLDGLHFYRVHRSDNLDAIDFHALKEAAWNYIDYLDADV